MEHVHDASFEGVPELFEEFNGKAIRTGGFVITHGTNAIKNFLFHKWSD